MCAHLAFGPKLSSAFRAARMHPLEMLPTSTVSSQTGIRTNTV
jgi:hypothetical protein